MDGFIDEIFTITIDDPNWFDHASLLIIHTIFRLKQALDPLTQDEPLSPPKLSGGGQMA